MAEPAQPGRALRFADFEVDLQAGELRKNGHRIRLQAQPFQVLALMLERPGETIARDELRQRLWPSDTFVDFDHGLNNAINRLREALNDSVDSPRFIETVPKRGYRFIARVENGAQFAATSVEESATPHTAGDAKSSAAIKRRWILASGVATALLAAALLVSHVYFSPPALADTDVILLASFVNKTGDPIFDNSLDKALEVKLAESPYLSLLSEADARETLRTMRHDPGERVTRELGIEICKRQGLKAVVVGEITAFGSSYLITLDATNASTGRSIARSQEDAKSKDDVVAALGKAGSRLRRRLGESLNSLEKYNAPLDLATTSSLEALQAYRAGQAQYRGGKRRDAVPLFQRAVELDPQFCSAYSMLGSAYHSIGDEQASRTNFAKAFELKDRRLTLEENYRTTALYYAGVTGDLDKEIALLVSYKQAYPRSVGAYNLLGIAYAQIGRLQEALPEFRWAIEHSPVPSAPSYSNASQALMILGRLDEAKQLLDEWLQKGSLTSFQRALRYQIAFVEHDAATMARIEHEAPADDIPWLELQSRLAFFRGEIGKMRSLSRAIVEQQTRAKRMENAVDQLATQAVFESYLGNYSVARQLCHQADAAGNHSASGLVNCAKALANSGDLTQAETVAAQLDRLFPEDTCRQRVHLPIIRSIVERQRGHAAKALDLLAPAAQYEQTTLQLAYERAQDYLAVGDATSAAAELEKIVTQQDWPEMALYGPLARLSLARAYEKQRRQDDSLKAYDSFFAGWKDADSDALLLIQAKVEQKKIEEMPTVSVLTSQTKLKKPI